MDPTTAADLVGRNIQLAVAPVFLIAGVGALLNVLSTRLSRVVDRGRIVEREFATAPEGASHDALFAELATLDTRMVRLHRAIMLSVVCMLLVSLVIVVLFTGELTAADLSISIAALFILSMIVLIASLISFLGEITLAAKSNRIRREFRKR